MALPKDDEPTPEWTNENVAYLNVIQGASRRRNIHAQESSSSASELSAPEVGGRRLKIKQEFYTIQGRDFGNTAFRVIRDYFKTSCDELNKADDLRARFENMTDNSFTS